MSGASNPPPSAPSTLPMEGIRWPAEWEPHAATWLAWPHNPETWPGCHEAAIREYVGLVRALHVHEPVHILVDDEAMEADARQRLAGEGIDLTERVRLHRVPTNDAWLRDSGPIAVRQAVDRGAEGAGRALLLDFPFDSWGGKYPPWDRDAAVPRAIADLTGLARIEADFVLEGGSVDGNGRGLLLTTESCLLNPNRGPGRTRDSMQALLSRWLGAREVVWLGAGIEGDDTDGHVDDIARFVAPGIVVAAVAEDPGDPNHAPLAESLRRLRAFRSADGGALEVIPLPMPSVPMPRLPTSSLPTSSLPTSRGQGGGATRAPASYANFYLANGVALVPTFGVPEDAGAVAILSDVLPNREVVAVPCAALVEGLGAIHCLTQQQIA